MTVGVTLSRDNHARTKALKPAAHPKPRCFTNLIDQIIRDQGFSVREAKKIRKAIFNIWARALYCGEIVETPIGEMKVKRGPKRQSRINKLNNKQQTVAINTHERRIIFKPYPWLVEIVPTKFYNEAESAILKRMGREPWAADVPTKIENAKILEKHRVPTQQELKRRWQQKQLGYSPP